MSVARQMAIAKVLRDSLNNETLSQEFTATAKSIQLADLPDVQDLTVTVVPRSRNSLRKARRIWVDIYQIGVAIQGHASHTDQAILDGFDFLTEEITDFLDRLGRVAGATLLPETEVNPLFNSSHLIEQKQYLAVPTFSYRIEREL